MPLSLLFLKMWDKADFSLFPVSGQAAEKLLWTFNHVVSRAAEASGYALWAKPTGKADGIGSV